MDSRQNFIHHDSNKKHKESKYHHPLLDPKSGLVHENKHWIRLSELDPKDIDNLIEGKAPSTRMQEEKLCDGILHLSGDFFMAHKQEILNTLHNVAKIAEEHDPLNRIESVEEIEPGKVTVYTIKNQLASRMGKKIDESFKGGELKIHWMKDDKPVEIWWHKDV
jgi:hypothetical protein